MIEPSPYEGHGSESDIKDIGLPPEAGIDYTVQV
jgi:hypothetical protein